MRHPDKTRENRARRAAKRQGLLVHKSMCRDPRAIGYGSYWLSGPDGRPVELSRERGSLALSLDEVEAFLKGES